MNEPRQTEGLGSPLHIAALGSSQHRLGGGSPTRLFAYLWRELEEMGAQVVECAELASADLEGLGELARPVGHYSLAMTSQ